MYIFLINIILVLHLFVFLIILTTLYIDFYDSKSYCICGTNPLTNIIYICTKNAFVSFFTNFVPIHVMPALFYDPYTYMFPLKISYSNMICRF